MRIIEDDSTKFGAPLMTPHSPLHQASGERALTMLPELLAGYDRFVDVGANDGLYTIAAAQSATVSEIIAIEADPGIAERLSNRLETIARDNRVSIRVVHAAAGDSDEPIIFSRGLHSHCGSLVRDQQGEKVSVRQVTLDSLGLHTGRTLFKVDVEGAEHRVLLGAADLARSGRCSFLVEVHGFGDTARNKYPLDVLHFFYRHGFDVERIGALHMFRPSKDGARRGYMRALPSFVVRTWLNKYFQFAKKPLIKLTNVIGLTSRR